MASGKHALGMCKRCGFLVSYSELRPDGYNKGLLVCGECYDLPEAKEPSVDDNPNLKRPSPDPLTDRGTATTLVSAMGFDTYFGGGT